MNEWCDFSPILLVEVEDGQHKYGSCVYLSQLCVWGEKGNSTRVSSLTSPGGAWCGMATEIDYLFCTKKDVRDTGTYLIFLPSSNNIIYFLFKNNTHIFSLYKIMMSINILPKPSNNDVIYFSSKSNTHFFPFINNDVNYYPSKRKNNVNYVSMYVQRKICIY